MSQLPTFETKQFFGHRSKVSAVVWNLDGTRLAAAGDAAGLIIYDTERIEANGRPERRRLHELRGHSKNIEVVMSSTTSPHMFASAGQDSLINIYDVRTDTRPVQTIKTDSACLFGEWSPDGNSVVVGADTNNLYIVDCLSWKVSKRIPFDGEINQFRWSVDGKRIYFTRGDGSVDVFHWPSMSPFNSFRGHVDTCLGIACDPKGRFIAVTSMDTCVSVWDASSLTNLFTIDRWEVAVQLAEYSHDGQYLAVMGEKDHIDITDATNGTLLFSIPTGTLPNNMAWHPRRRLLAYSPSSPRERYTTAEYQPMTCVWGLTRS